MDEKEKLEDLLSTLTLILKEEYPKSNVKLDMVTDEIGTDDAITKEIYVLIILQFIFDENKYHYKLIRSMNTFKKNITDYSSVFYMTKKTLLNSLLFNQGELHIPNLLSGKVEPSKELLI